MSQALTSETILNVYCDYKIVGGEVYAIFVATFEKNQFLIAISEDCFAVLKQG